MDQIIKCIKDKYWDTIKKKPNVIGFSGKLRERIRNGKTVSGTKVFRVYVESKVNSISCKEMVPSTLQLDVCDCGISGIETDIVEIGKIKYMNEADNKTVPIDHQKRYRPYMAGISSTNEYSTACTMNIPYKKIEGINKYKLYVSSNNHCFARENDAQPGELILQPSPYDGGTPEVDEIGKFAFGVETKYNGYECPIRNILNKIYKAVYRVVKFKKLELLNVADISFAEPYNDLDVGYEIFGVEGKVVGKGGHSIGTKVIKSGRTTAVTEGSIIDNNWIGIVQGSRGSATYTDCVLCEMVCAGGDSGSPIVSRTEDGNLIYHGALFAGSDQGITIYCKVENIEKESGLQACIY